MKIDGQWVGLGLGDVSEEVRLIKAFMARKFSYAKTLADTPTFDAELVIAVAKMQANYNGQGRLASGKYLPGVVNLDTKYVMGFIQRPPGPDTRPVLFTLCGTGVPYWVGPDADLARAVEDRYRWQPCAYPAAPFPMGPSINAGKTELGVQLNRAEPGFMLRQQVEKYGAVLAGYSQGAVITSEVWEFDIKPAGGYLNWAKDHIIKAVTWGNPSRELNAVYPDFAPGQSVAPRGTSGVAYIDDRMKDTPPWWRNYAHKGDLYAAAEQGESGEDKTAIWRIVRGEKFFVGPDTLLEQFLEISQSPLPGAIGAFKAMMDAGMFFVKGTGPHVTYRIDEAVNFLRAG